MRIKVTKPGVGRVGPTSPSSGAGWRERAGATATIRLLVLTQLAFNLGFYMVLPYLAVHLSEDLGLAASLVGLVLGVRTFSQQGLFAVGGLLTDRIGVKPVVIVGCLLRVAGLIGLALAGTAWGAVAAVLVMGLAAALFSPAVEAALAREAGEVEAQGGPEQTRAFAQFTVSGEVGALVGPLLGALLLLWDFRIACWAAAALFGMITLGHLRWLPAREAQHRDEPVLDGWSEVLRNRVFVIFALGYSGYLITYTQMYLLLPLEVRRATGADWPLGWLFAVSAVLVIVLQVRATVWAGTRLGAPRALGVGFLLMASGVAVMALAAPAGLQGLVGLLPSLAFVLLFTLGQILVVPLARQVVARLAGGRRLGAYFGVLSSVSGCLVLLGSTATGLLMDGTPSTGPGAGIPWAAAALVPLASWAGLRVLARHGHLSAHCSGPGPGPGHR